MEFVAKVFGLGRITIPQYLRELLQIETGDIVRLTIEKVEKKEGS